jgi:hypothetical protein
MATGIDIPPAPTAEEEAKHLFQNSDEHRKQLQNERMRDENQIRLDYVKSAKSLAETWIGFSIVMAITQLIKPFGMQFSDTCFVAIIATALGSVIALWAIVGRGVFGTGNPPKE